MLLRSSRRRRLRKLRRARRGFLATLEHAARRIAQEAARAEAAPEGRPAAKRPPTARLCACGEPRRRGLFICDECLTSSGLRECDCGSPKEPTAEACARCEFLDGGSARAARLIGALRALGGSATLEALALELGVHPRKVNEALAEVAPTGRVQRQETGEEFHVNQPMWVLDDVRTGPTCGQGDSAHIHPDAFLDAGCVFEPDAEATTADLWAAFKSFAEASRRSIGGLQSLTAALRQRGCSKTAMPGRDGERGRRAGWRGVRLKAGSGGAVDVPVGVCTPCALTGVSVRSWRD